MRNRVGYVSVPYRMPRPACAVFSSRQLAASFPGLVDCFDQSAAAGAHALRRVPYWQRRQPIGRSSRCFHIPKTIFTASRVALADLAHGVGTPAYVYSSQAILANYREYDEPSPIFRTRFVTR